MIVLLSLLIAVIGLLIYAFANNKLSEIGRIMFFCGLFVFLFTADKAIALLR